MCRITAIVACFFAFACAGTPRAPAQPQTAEVRDQEGLASDRDPETRYRLAQDFEKRALIDDAFTAYGEAVRYSNGSYKPALFGVARLADKLGRKDDVADACQPFIDGSPDDELGEARTWCLSRLRTARR